VGIVDKPMFNVHRCFRSRATGGASYVTIDVTMDAPVVFCMVALGLAWIATTKG
jgi:hypothetical protein